MANLYGNSPLPPAPSGLSDTEMTYLRTVLDEQTLQLLLKYARSRNNVVAIDTDYTLDEDAFLATGWKKVTVPYTDLIADATTQTITLFTLPAKTKIVGAIADVTAALDGIDGNLTCKYGTEDDDDGLLVSFAVDATGTFGLTDAQTGAGLKAASAVQGGHIPSWSADKEVTVKFASDDDHFGDDTATTLTAGSVTFYLKLETIP